MGVKTCQICGKPSGIYPLCKEHLLMKQEGLVVKNEDTGNWELVVKDEKKTRNQILTEKKYEKCILCGGESKGKPLCKDCYYECQDLEDEVDRNKKPFELKDYYFSLKSANYRVVDRKNVIRNCKMMVALANVTYDSYDDSSLITRLNDDISEIITTFNSKKEVKPTSFTEQSDSQKSSIMRTLDGHIVKSQGERIIDDILYNSLLVHCYEKDVIEICSEERTVKSDWFIPIVGNKGVYIEYWGMNTGAYLKNKEEKRKMYIENEIPLIEIEKDDIKDVAGLTTRINREYNSWKKKILK